MPMGGGSSTSDALVQFTDPASAMRAGNLGFQGAFEASQMANNQIQTAIQQLNKQYQSAITGLQPYNQTGIEALDKMNQYIGLSPYTPTQAPEKPTLASLAASATPGDLQNYIMQNTQLGNQPGYTNPGARYTGYGTEGSAPTDWWTNGGVGGNPGNFNMMDAVMQELSNPLIGGKNGLAAQGFAQDSLASATKQYTND